MKLYEKDLPKDLKLSTGFDNSVFIRASIAEVEDTIIEAFVLVVVIIFLFLRDWRSTLIPVVAIPVSLIGIFFVMYLLDFSINVLTLLAIVLAIGLVVDDAIVVLENIYSRIEDGEARWRPPSKAPRKFCGRGEHHGGAGGGVSAGGVSDGHHRPAVPRVRHRGGRLGADFGLRVAHAHAHDVRAAAEAAGKHNWFYRKTEPFFERLTDGYRSAWKPSCAPLAGLGAGGGDGRGHLVFHEMLPSELAPVEDRNRMNISATARKALRSSTWTPTWTTYTKVLADSAGQEAWTTF